MSDYITLTGPVGVTKKLEVEFSVPNAIIANSSPFCLIHRDENDIWNPSLDEINSKDYNYVKLHRLSGSFDIGLSDPYCIHYGFDGSFILPVLSDYFPMEKAIQKFNQILGEILMGGIYFNAITIKDIGYGILYKTGYVRSLGRSTSYEGRLRDALKTKQASSFFSLELYHPVNYTSKQIHQARRDGLEIFNSVPNVSPVYFILGLTSFMGIDWPSAILNFWICIEQIISFLWDSNISDGGKQPDEPIEGRKALLKDDRTWLTSTKIEVLFQKDIIDEALYRYLSRARKSRNFLIHEGRLPEKHDAEAAFDAIFMLFSCVIPAKFTFLKHIAEEYKSRLDINEIKKHGLATKGAEGDNRPIPVEEMNGIWTGPLPPIPGEDEWGDEEFEEVYTE